MAQTTQTWFNTTLASKLSPADTTLELATAPTITAGRVKVWVWSTAEWVKFTGLSGTTLTGLVRWLSKTAIPATAGTGLSHVAGTVVKIVFMHDQLLDREIDEVIIWEKTFEQTIVTEAGIEATSYADETARNTALGGNGVATKAYTNIYVESTGLYYNYNLSNAQWEEIDTGTVTPNASETVAGKKQDPTDAEVTAGTDVGSTWATMSPTPSQVAKVSQSWSYLYAGASAVGTDSYVVTMTPTLTAYTTGMMVSFLTDVANTWACTIDIDSLWVKDIKDINGSDPSDWRLWVWKIINLMYDGTDFIIHTSLWSATTTTWELTATDEAVTPASLAVIRATPSNTLWTSTLLATAPTSWIVPTWWTYIVDHKIITVAVAWTYQVVFTWQGNWFTPWRSWYLRVFVNGSPAWVIQWFWTDSTTLETRKELITVPAWATVSLRSWWYAWWSWTSWTITYSNFQIYSWLMWTVVTLDS